MNKLSTLMPRLDDMPASIGDQAEDRRTYVSHRLFGIATLQRFADAWEERPDGLLALKTADRLAALPA